MPPMRGGGGGRRFPALDCGLRVVRRATKLPAVLPETTGAPKELVHEKGTERAEEEERGSEEPCDEDEGWGDNKAPAHEPNSADGAGQRRISSSCPIILVMLPLSSLLLLFIY